MHERPLCMHKSTTSGPILVTPVSLQPGIRCWPLVQATTAARDAADQSEAVTAVRSGGGRKAWLHTGLQHAGFKAPSSSA